mgnify:FL=1
MSVTIIRQADIRRCPHVIFNPTHYRADGTCRCNDPTHTEMKTWGYKWDDVFEVWGQPGRRSRLADFTRALDLDHPSDSCRSNYCDICAARCQGFIYVSVFLLPAATETPTLDRVIDALDMPRNPDGRPRGWARWTRWFRNNTIKCPSCESFVFTDVPHTSCGNCLTPLE